MAVDGVRWFVRAAVLAAVLAGGACGEESDVNDVVPESFSGGGVGSGDIRGELNVYVIDEVTGSPLVGAAVRVGEPAAAAPLAGTTDGTGLVTFSGGALSGPQTITASAAGHAPATWFGANGANVTVPLSPNPEPAVQTATATGTIEGWEAMAEPAAGHYRLGVALYSESDELGAPENEIEQPDGPGGMPQNVCAYVPGAMTGPCSWTLATRTGKQVHFAIIVDGDAHGTPADFEDDTHTVTGYAVKRGLDLAAGATSSGEVLVPLAAGDLVDVTVAFPAAPAGLDTLFAAPVLRTADEGGLPFSMPPLSPDLTTSKVPALAGPFATGCSYDLRALAMPAGPESGAMAISFVHDVDVRATIAIPAFLAPPANVAAAGGTYSFTATAGAALHTADFEDAAGNIVWSVALLDGRTSFSLPALTPDPLPAGALTLLVHAATAPGFDPQGFEVDVVKDALTAMATNAATFTH